ncbi:hypothetical protein RHMOL_Rhmol12G0146900 [Rhododendron molle]|uniref:Uncharacterized protein n=1 Tax=Rhododendron molle TaxID=49168 RepID=A0ACC0LI08_RHOML|nr:hypothetical protein RHMOL_Rhmol12G0146900 [Rhododendron molle]
MWSDVPFEHPVRFESIAMEAEKKQEIIEDLLHFSQSKDFYSRIGKAWKRGYLPYGPPGTGKSTMIAAMANLLNYDVYDLELGAVKDNTELRLDLTGQRKRRQRKKQKTRMSRGKKKQTRRTQRKRVSAELRFEGFKVLAKNYLLVEAHPLFEMIEKLTEETKIMPADVAEALMPKSFREDAEKCLWNLIDQALEEAN